MTTTEDTWGAAYDARNARVHAHPAYGTLFRKVARAEAEWGCAKPISSRYRAGRHDIAIYWDGPDGDPTFHTPRYGQTIIRHPAATYGPAEPVADAWKFAESLIEDVYDDRDRWPSVGDMTAAVYGAARDDVRARIDGRRPR